MQLTLLLTQGEAVWFPPLSSCAITGAEKLRVGILVDLFADVILLTIMLAGVMNKRNGTGLWYVRSHSRYRVVAEALLGVCYIFRDFRGSS